MKLVRVVHGIRGMKQSSPLFKFRALAEISARLLGCLFTLGTGLGAFSALAAPQGEILSREGSVDYSPNQTVWSPAVAGQPLNVADRVRTLAESRALLQLAELGRLRVNERTTLEVLPPRNADGKATIDLKAGAIYFFTRDRPREFQIQTPYALAASRGTEFSVVVDPDGTSHYIIFDGQVGVTNNLGGVVLGSGDEGEARPGSAPVKTAVIQARNIVQWWLYYPGVIDLQDLPLAPAEQAALTNSLLLYRQGDLLGALARYPAGRTSQSVAGQTYHAALLLAVGQVSQSMSELDRGNALPAANALREVVAATSQNPFTNPTPPGTASEWLARSYTWQSRYDLAGALKCAHQAVTISPDFGFAWERVAELEFSFGHIAAANDALDSALKFAPRNAQAWALKGFLAAARERFDESRDDFQQAIQLDPALGNAWLGRGLVEFHRREREAGRADLQTAAALEPNRSILRSYLGKGFDESDDTANSERELRLAKQLDEADPTPWLYSALVLRQQLRFNEAVDDLEKSADLNDNRRVYRSQMLLDQDRAVRSASLATIYQDDGMDDVSVREAARAVDNDYANYSAHLFLSDSYNALRDPTDFNLRYDTPWLNELLLANILAPPGAGTLSRNVSQHEYSKLFESDRLGLSTDSQYGSDGALTELVSQYGSHGGTSYALDLDYRHYEGVRPNNDLERIEWFSQIKQQLSPKDSVMALVEYRDYNSGDNFQYYNPDTESQPTYRYREDEKPNILGAYRHEWTPDIQTLVLGGYLQDQQRFSNNNSPLFALQTNGTQIAQSGKVPFNIQQQTRFEVLTLELNQIVQNEHGHLVAGGKIQSGNFRTSDQLVPLQLQAYFVPPDPAPESSDPFQRYSAYSYYTRELFPDLSITAGLSYEWMRFPSNFRNPPVDSGTTGRGQFNPKAALVWSPAKEVTFRGIYARGLSGLSYDQSYRLEPTELAGFVQSFGSVIPESVVGSVSAADCTVFGGAMDLKFKTRTYFGVQAQVLKAGVNQDIGAFYLGQFPPPITPGSTAEKLDYTEANVAATLNQLIGNNWSLGTSYHYTHSRLEDDFTDIPASMPGAASTVDAGLHELSAFLIYNHPSGFFVRVENNWYHQGNSGYNPALADSDFSQQNLYVGWRLKRQRGEISFGWLDISDTDYRLNPLTVYNELPRSRTFVGRIKLNF